MNPETKTPRTDAGSRAISDWLRTQPDIEVVATDFARQLEIELAACRAALQPIAELLAGDLENVGGGTLIAPTIKVQVVKDARAALSNVAPSHAEKNL